MAKKKDNPVEYLIPAGLVIGTGFGFLYNQLVAYTLIGLGVGLLLYFVASTVDKK